jgi:hypothetical protein
VANETPMASVAVLSLLQVPPKSKLQTKVSSSTRRTAVKWRPANHTSISSIAIATLIALVEIEAGDISLDSRLRSLFFGFSIVIRFSVGCFQCDQRGTFHHQSLISNCHLILCSRGIVSGSKKETGNSELPTHVASEQLSNEKDGDSE